MRILHRIGIGLLDMLLLTAALCYIFLGTKQNDELMLFSADATFIFILVVVMYVGVVAVVSLLTTTMRQDSWMANLAKSIVSGVVIIALFEWVLWPVLWVFGYSTTADIRFILIVTSLGRSLMKIWLRRRWGGGGE